MREAGHSGPDTGTVLAARSGDGEAMDRLLADCLPLVYNIVGRALNGHSDVDDVVQETLLRVVRGLPELRDPAAFRSWLIAIAVRRIRDRERTLRSAGRHRAELESAEQLPDPAADFVGLTVLRLGLTDQRRQLAEATRWLDGDDRSLLALWWLEETGELSRAELAEALGVSRRHAAVRVQRMKEQMQTARLVVGALAAAGDCAELSEVLRGWDGVPSPLWRKRIARHVRGCAECGHGGRLLPMERLLAGLPLLPVPYAGPSPWDAASLSDGFTPSGPGPHGDPHAFAHPDPYPAAPASPAPVPRTTASSPRRGGAHRAGRGGALRRHPVASAAAAAAVAAAVVTPWLLSGSPAADSGTVRTADAPAALPSPVPRTPAPSASASVSPAPRPTGSASASRTAKPDPSRKPAASPSPAPVRSAGAPAAPQVSTVSSDRKGVGVWAFPGADRALARSGAGWYYTWAASPRGVVGSGAKGFVPMVWGEKSVDAANLATAKANGPYLLGFNEPDMAEQSDMSVDRALELWPKLMATGKVLGSPAVAYGGDTAGGWLDRFMTGAAARGYRVDFVALHWYGGDFRTGPAVEQLRSYLEAVHRKYGKPVWLTEYALTDFSHGTRFPSAEQQAAFVTASTRMLDSLPYVRRYAWFGLPAADSGPSTGLYRSGAVETEVGRAYRQAR
ncbi:sigma-70 family RNA polymerase sigma factor [Streptomyces sp. NPDC007088]|uniref:sigma-70 family RNA polymerase sigma factor n=1 Tax=Streptomyces sp. NPDC007088 TaxID=3364773 RepID=UPI0036B31807